MSDTYKNEKTRLQESVLMYHDACNVNTVQIKSRYFALSRTLSFLEIKSSIVIMVLDLPLIPLLSAHIFSYCICTDHLKIT